MTPAPIDVAAVAAFMREIEAPTTLTMICTVYGRFPGISPEDLVRAAAIASEIAWADLAMIERENAGKITAR